MRHRLWENVINQPSAPHLSTLRRDQESVEIALLQMRQSWGSVRSRAPSTQQAPSIMHPESTLGRHAPKSPKRWQTMVVQGSSSSLQTD